MIYGIGIDIVEIDKVKKIVDRSGDRLAQRIFSESELRMYYKKKYPVYFLSKRFVAKEAALKAFGTGINKGIGFDQIEILNDQLGKPVVRLFSNAAELFRDLSLTKIHITLSDTDQYAFAMVVFEY